MIRIMMMAYANRLRSSYRLPRYSEIKELGILEEESSPLREEKAEARQVDLLVVDFHLSEVRVVSEV